MYGNASRAALLLLLARSLAHSPTRSLPWFDASAGQRYATVVIYLGTPEEGGETTFPRINAAVPAVKGDAILFWSLHPDLQLNPNAMHGSNKVVRGTKYAAAKWIRVNPTYRGA